MIGELRLEQAADLVGHGREDLRRVAPPCHERRHPPLCSLLLGEPDDLPSGLGVRDGRRDEVGELGEAKLGFGREPFGSGRDEDCAPECAAHNDRTADRRLDPAIERTPGDRIDDGRVVVDPVRPSGAEDDRRDAVAGGLGEETRSERKDAGDRLTPAADVGGGSIGVVAQERALDASEQPAGFLGDLGEHLLREVFLGDERRHPPQGGLLVGELLDLGARLGVGDRRCDQIGERGQSLLGAGGKRLGPLRRDEHDAPDADPRR